MNYTYLFLGPDKVRVGVLVKMRSQKVIRQGRQLLKPRKGNIVDTSLFALLEELEVDLTSTQNMSSDLLGLDKGFGMRFREVSLELGLPRHLLEGRSGMRMSEKGFGEEDNQLEWRLAHFLLNSIASLMMTYRLSETTLVLSPENVEVVGRGGGVDDLHVAVLVLPLQLFR